MAIRIGAATTEAPKSREFGLRKTSIFLSPGCAGRPPASRPRDSDPLHRRWSVDGAGQLDARCEVNLAGIFTALSG